MRFAWITAWLLAVAGPALYVAGEIGWWPAAGAVLPVTVLAILRAERDGDGPVEIHGPMAGP